VRVILFETIDELVVRHLQGGPLQWWAAATRGSFDRIRFLAAFSGAGRRFGRGLWDEALLMPATFTEQGFLAVGRPWAELGRVGMLLSLPGRMPSKDLQTLVAEAYRTGDLGEKQAVLRALAFLPEPLEYLEIAADGARSNALAIAEAITCDNPYPAKYFSEDALNQMTMKALFNALPLSRFVGLPQRMNADLIRMARDYGKERRAAGRSISQDLAMLEQEGPAL
jgi:hypothetical protein